MNNKNQGKNYDNIAKGFANIRNEFATEKKYIDEFIRYLKPLSHILDVGCGWGVPIAQYLITKQFEVCGIDGSRELIQLAKKSVPKLNAICCDIRDFKPTTHYEGIIEWWCMFHLPHMDQLRMLEKFYEWLKPGGVLEFTSAETYYEAKDSNMLNQDLHFYSYDKIEYEKKLASLGFNTIFCESDQKNHLVWLLNKPL